MIPKILHFIFGLKKDFGGIPFSMTNYISLRPAFEVNYPCKIYFYYKYMPTGEWWERAKKFVTPIEVSVPRKIYGNKLYHYAHKADVLRILILLKFGGIYLDIDTVWIKPFKPLLNLIV